MYWHVIKWRRTQVYCEWTFTHTRTHIHIMRQCSKNHTMPIDCNHVFDYSSVYFDIVHRQRLTQRSKAPQTLWYNFKWYWTGSCFNDILHAYISMICQLMTTCNARLHSLCIKLICFSLFRFTIPATKNRYAPVTKYYLRNVDLPQIYPLI